MQSSHSQPRSQPHSQPHLHPPAAVQTNIRRVADLEREFEQRRSPSDRIADLIGGFTGSLSFVVLHAAFFVLWFLVNTGVLRFLPRFDPYPFIFLSMIVSVEAVLLSTFVLMKQNRMQQRNDIRDHLNLQIDLLSEKEITRLLQLTLLICRKLEIPEAAIDKEIREMARTTSVDTVAMEIESKMPPPR